MERDLPRGLPFGALAEAADASGGLSFSAFGGRDPATVRHACRAASPPSSR